MMGTVLLRGLEREPHLVHGPGFGVIINRLERPWLAESFVIENG